VSKTAKYTHNFTLFAIKGSNNKKTNSTKKKKRNKTLQDKSNTTRQHNSRPDIQHTVDKWYYRIQRACAEH